MYGSRCNLSDFRQTYLPCYHRRNGNSCAEACHRPYSARRGELLMISWRRRLPVVQTQLSAWRICPRARVVSLWIHRIDHFIADVDARPISDHKKFNFAIGVVNETMCDTSPGRKSGSVSWLETVQVTIKPQIWRTSHHEQELFVFAVRVRKRTRPSWWQNFDVHTYPFETQGLPQRRGFDSHHALADLPCVLCNAADHRRLMPYVLRWRCRSHLRTVSAS
jgi:hypothetical protein